MNYNTKKLNNKKILLLIILVLSILISGLVVVNLFFPFLYLKNLPYSFSLLSDILKLNNCASKFGYHKTLTGVHYDNRKLENVDLKSFIILGDNMGLDYAKDKNNVFIYGNKADKFDAKTFEFVNSSFIKDKNGVYYTFYKDYENKGVIPEDDNNSNITNIADSACDRLDELEKHPVKSEEKENGDIVVNTGKGEDFIISKIDDIDYESFVLIKPQDGFLYTLFSDKNNLYTISSEKYYGYEEKNGKLFILSKFENVSIDIDSIQAISSTSFKDKNGIYEINEVNNNISFSKLDADTDSYKDTGSSQYSIDKNYVYSRVMDVDGHIRLIREEDYDPKKFVSEKKCVGVLVSPCLKDEEVIINDLEIINLKIPKYLFDVYRNQKSNFIGEWILKYRQHPILDKNFIAIDRHKNDSVIGSNIISAKNIYMPNGEIVDLKKETPVEEKKLGAKSWSKYYLGGSILIFTTRYGEYDIAVVFYSYGSSSNKGYLFESKDDSDILALEKIVGSIWIK